MAADVLSDVLKAVRLTGAAFFSVAAGDPWVAEQPVREMVLPKILPGAEHLISYHVVTEGRCYASMIGGETIPVEAGEVVVFTHGDAHVMSSHPGMRAQPVRQEAFDRDTSGPLPFFASYGDEQAVSARLVCGFLACDARPFNPLLQHLPPVIKSRDSAEGEGGWLGRFIEFAMSESASRRAGGESILARLSELMFIEVVRRHLESLPPEKSGWLAGLKDPFIGKALSLMHAHPARRWTLDDLACEVGLSRSVLAERFTEIVGTPPLQYLARWRMQIALAGLSGNANIARIAADIGYESEAAFSRAFKKMMGVPPSAWRRRAG